MAAYAKAEKFYTEEEYLERERNEQTRSEYFAGRIYEMAGASRRHNIITLNTGSELRSQLKHQPCEVYVTDMRVKVEATGLNTYPDVVVVCGQPRFQGVTLLNPKLIAEVLSESTQEYDRWDKFAQYQQIQTLTDYILIEQDEMRIDHFVRGENNEWLQATITQPDMVLEIASLDCRLVLAEVYDKVTFHQENEQESA